MSWPVLAKALLLAAALAGCDRPSTTTSAPAVAASATAAAASEGNAMPAATSSSTPPAIAPVRTLGTFTNRLGFRHLYLLVPTGLSDAQLVALAKGVHAREKDAWLWLLDSDAQADALLAALPKVEKGDAVSLPREWFRAHTRAYSVLEIVPKAQGGGRRWALYRGPYATEDLLTVLPCVDGAGGCK